MTDYEYDPNLPYVVTNGVVAVARFINRDVARDFLRARQLMGDVEIIDTTPKPHVPEDAKWIAYPAYGPGEHESWELSLASRAAGEDLWFAGGSELACPLSELPGVTPDTVFTVLSERQD